MNVLRKCISPCCGDKFRPQFDGHIFCSEGCWTGVLHTEIGKTAAGMRPLGFMGDGKKIAAVRRKYERLAGVRK